MKNEDDEDDDDDDDEDDDDEYIISLFYSKCHITNVSCYTFSISLALRSRQTSTLLLSNYPSSCLDLYVAQTI